MKIVVFGGSGFIGSHVCDKLSEANHEVIIADCFMSPWLKNNQKMKIGNIIDIDFVDETCKNADIVMNFAGIADLNDADIDPVKTIHINVMGNLHILEACRKYKVKRYVFASSLYVYGNHGGFYRCSKQSSELFIEEYHKKYGLEYTLSVYGSRADEKNGMYKFVKQAMTEGKITYYGMPNAVREYIDVEDASRASVEILKEEYANSNIMLTGHQGIQISQLFLMIAEILGKDIEFEYKTHPENTHYFVTPYNFMPKVGKKLHQGLSTDLGQGLLQIMHEINEME